MFLKFASFLRQKNKLKTYSYVLMTAEAADIRMPAAPINCRVCRLTYLK